MENIAIVTVAYNRVKSLSRLLNSLLCADIDNAPLIISIDKSNIFKGHSVKEDRSTMNVCFRANDPNIESEFLSICEKEGFDGLKGHRSVGGLRASIYNAMEIDTVKLLGELMNDFEKRKG